MLRQLSKMASAQHVLRKAIELRDKGLGALPQKRIMGGAFAAKTLYETGRGLDLARQHYAGFYPPGSY